MDSTNKGMKNDKDDENNDEEIQSKTGNGSQKGSDSDSSENDPQESVEGQSLPADILPELERIPTTAVASTSTEMQPETKAAIPEYKVFSHDPSRTDVKIKGEEDVNDSENDDESLQPQTEEPSQEESDRNSSQSNLQDSANVEALPAEILPELESVPVTAEASTSTETLRQSEEVIYTSPTKRLKVDRVEETTATDSSESVSGPETSQSDAEQLVKDILEQVTRTTFSTDINPEADPTFPGFLGIKKKTPVKRRFSVADISAASSRAPHYAPELGESSGYSPNVATSEEDRKHAKFPKLELEPPERPAEADRASYGERRSVPYPIFVPSPSSFSHSRTGPDGQQPSSSKIRTSMAISSPSTSSQGKSSLSKPTQSKYWWHEPYEEEEESMSGDQCSLYDILDLPAEEQKPALRPKVAEVVELVFVNERELITDIIMNLELNEILQYLSRRDLLVDRVHRILEEIGLHIDREEALSEDETPFAE